LQAELAKLEAVVGGHRADFAWERDQGQKLMAEFLKMIAVTMTAKKNRGAARGRASITEGAALVASACRVICDQKEAQKLAGKQRKCLGRGCCVV
jgi:hypothetical protein